MTNSVDSTQPAYSLRTKLVAALILCTILGGFAFFFVVVDLHLIPRAKTARRILESLGYTQVRITGVNPLRCAEDDVFRTGFEAVSFAGKPVRGTVCQGWFKGATVRLR